MTQEQAHEHPRSPDAMTEPCFRYFKAHAELAIFIESVTLLAKSLDEINKEAAKTALAFRRSRNDLEDGMRETLEWARKEGAGAVKLLRAQRQLLYQMTFCRAVNNYLTYLSEIMALIFRTKPETLKSGETIKLDALLQHETMDDVISTLTERRVDELSYRGMRALHGHLSDKLRFKLFQEDDKLETAASIIEVRNIIVHNSAVANRRFLSRVLDHPAKLGKTLKLEPDPVSDVVDFLAESCFDIDGRAASKFGLPQPKSGEHLIGERTTLP